LECPFSKINELIELALYEAKWKREGRQWQTDSDQLSSSMNVANAR